MSHWSLCLVWSHVYYLCLGSPYTFSFPWVSSSSWICVRWKAGKLSPSTLLSGNVLRFLPVLGAPLSPRLRGTINKLLLAPHITARGCRKQQSMQCQIQTDIPTDNPTVSHRTHITNSIRKDKETDCFVVASCLHGHEDSSRNLLGFDAV
jgi:hypothetical protein